MPHRLMVQKGSKTPCKICGGTLRCPRCNGEGSIRSNAWGFEDCERCGGSGRCVVCEPLFLDGQLEAVDIWEVYGDDESQWPITIRDFES